MGHTENPIKATINGQTYTLSEWALFSDMEYSTLYNRYKVGKRGEDLIAPVRNKEGEKKYKATDHLGTVRELWRGRWVWDRARVTDRFALEKLKNAELGIKNLKCVTLESQVRRF